MAWHLKLKRVVFGGMLLSLLLLFCACVTYLPRDEGKTQHTTAKTENPTEVTEEQTLPQTETSPSTDTDGFPNLPQDDQTKRY